MKWLKSAAMGRPPPTCFVKIFEIRTCVGFRLDQPHFLPHIYQFSRRFWGVFLSFLRAKPSKRFEVLRIPLPLRNHQKVREGGVSLAISWDKQKFIWKSQFLDSQYQHSIRLYDYNKLFISNIFYWFRIIINQNLECLANIRITGSVNFFVQRRISMVANKSL